MKLVKLLFVLNWLGLLPWLAQAQQKPVLSGPGQDPVSVTPAQPQRGQQVTIRYTPLNNRLKEAPVLIFTYSNFYELPWQLPLTEKAGSWYASFPLQRYATYATFFIKHGNDTIRPEPRKHYAITVYTAEKIPVKDGRLYQSYSLPAQMGRSPLVAAMSDSLLNAELADYPDNFQAKMCVFDSQLKKAPAQQKEEIRAKAHAFIKARFEQDPLANMNLATMGFLILGENHSDSIHNLIRERYPNSAIGTEMRIETIVKDKDTLRKIKNLEKELAAAGPASEGVKPAHRALFQYYADKGNGPEAARHARFLVTEKTPYLPEQLLKIALTMAQKQLLPDTALVYALRSRELADSFPAGLIRYFKETGYIPSYVPDSVKHQVRSNAKANSLAAISMIYTTRKETALAKRYADSAFTFAQDAEAWGLAAIAQERAGDLKQAYFARKQQLLSAPVLDSAMITAARLTYQKTGQEATGEHSWNNEWRLVKTAREQNLKTTMRNRLLQLAAPALSGIVTLSGKPVLPDTLKNKVILIDFWATWCIPCMQEMPYLQKVYDGFKNDPRVAFMIINSGSRNTLEDAKNWSGNKKYSFPVYYHTNTAVADLFGFNTIPAVYIIDSKGMLRYKHFGFEGPQVEEQLSALIQLLLES